MKAAKSALLLAIPALMVGCGGGSGGSGGGNSGGGTAPTTYTWQFVSLNSEAKANVSGSCAILAQDTSDNSGSSVIVPYIATNSNFNILYHNASGEVVESFNANSNGQHKINISQVPDNGYVSLEEAVGLSAGNKDVYMFTVHKDLVTNLLVNVRQHSSSYSCYRGEQFAELVTNSNSAVKVDQVSGSTEYYQTSYIDNAINGRDIASGIPVESPLPASNRVLVTLFEDYTNSKPTDLTHYVVMESNTIYDSSQGSGSQSGLPSDENLITPSIIANGLTISGNSRIDVDINNQIYTWQSIYSSPQQYSYVDGSSAIDGWAFNLEADAGNNWLSEIIAPVTSSGTNISVPTLSDFTTSSVTSAGCNSDFCLSASGYDDEDFQVQRTHLRSKTENVNRSFYQTIFAPANLEQVLMESSTEVLAPDSLSDKLEVSLAQLDTADKDALKQFFSKSISVQEIISDSQNQYFDTNGLISLPSDDKTRRLALMGEDLHVYKNSINYP